MSKKYIAALLFILLPFVAMAETPPEKQIHAIEYQITYIENSIHWDEVKLQKYKDDHALSAKIQNEVNAKRQSEGLSVAPPESNESYVRSVADQEAALAKEKESLVDWKKSLVDWKQYAQRTPATVAAPSSSHGTFPVLGFSADREVQIRKKGGHWMKFDASTTIDAGDMINVGYKGFVRFSYPDGHVTAVHALTLVEVSSNGALIERGSVNVQGAATTVSDFSIRTAVTTASVRGTEFAVNYDPDTKQALVAVREGTVLAIPTNRSLTPVTLNAGEQTFVTDATATPASPLDENSKALFDDSPSNPLLTFGLPLLVVLSLGLLLFSRYPKR